MHDNMTRIRHAYKTVESGDLDAAVELLTENFIINLHGVAEPLIGREIWKAGSQAMLEAFPDLRIEVQDMFAAGDKVAVHVRFSGTHTGPFNGVEPTHRQVNFWSLELYRFEDDKIAEEWVAPDLPSLMNQIG